MAYKMNYNEALEYIHSISWRGSRLGLERIKELLSLIGNPEKKLKFIHVAGTNGKGSVCAMLASILNKAGYNTGLYTSPFVLKFNERISANGKAIRDSELAELTGYVAEFAEKMSDPPTEFELITAIAFEYFRRKHCDIVVLEVGLGGELDSTNVIEKPELAIITALGLDHVSELGGTIEKIAEAKAGIIKPKSNVIFFGGEESAREVIKKKCDAVGATLSEVDFTSLRLKRSGISGFIFDFAGFRDLVIPLAGKYQLKNAALVLTAIEKLRHTKWDISELAVRAGLAFTKWPARFEVLMREPVFIFDGGHNQQGVQSALDSLSMHFPNRKIHFVVGVMADKDVSGMLDMIAPHALKLYAVAPDNTRALPSAKLCELARQKGIDAYDMSTPENGVREAIKSASEDGIVLALGSLYMYSQVVKAVDDYKAN